MFNYINKYINLLKKIEKFRFLSKKSRQKSLESHPKKVDRKVWNPTQKSRQKSLESHPKK